MQIVLRQRFEQIERKRNVIWTNRTFEEIGRIEEVLLACAHLGQPLVQPQQFGVEFREDRLELREDKRKVGDANARRKSAFYRRLADAV